MLDDLGFGGEAGASGAKERLGVKEGVAADGKASISKIVVRNVEGSVILAERDELVASVSTARQKRPQ